MMDARPRTPTHESGIPMFVYSPRNNRRLIFLGRVQRRLDKNAAFLLAVSLAFVTGVIIGALFF